MSNTRLLASKQYGPLFLTQFLGAFNDNFYKNAAVILVVFHTTAESSKWSEAQLSALASGIFILPFFLFSATAGQLADRMNKAQLMRYVKVAEILIMLGGSVGLIFNNLPVLLTALFAMGVHSSIYGPSKYSILPQLLRDDQLVAGNALIEMGTYIAILGGTLAGGLLIGLPGGPYIVSACLVGLAIAGRISSQFIPDVEAMKPDLTVSYNPIPPTWEILKLTKATQSVWLSILAISWFWAFGTAFLSLFAPYTKLILGADPQVATLFLAMFSAGIGIGSILCERLSRHRLELGLVPVGSIGMSLFTLDMFLTGVPWAANPDNLMTAWEFAARPMAWRILFDLLMIAISGGLFIVPLYTFIQQRSASSERSRIIAGNNVVNAIFMVGAAGALMGLDALGLQSWHIFLVLSVVNAGVAIYIYTVVPEFFLRFCIWVLSNLIYRIKVTGLHHIPAEGPALLVCNHVTFVDWMVIHGACRRPARFVMDKEYFDKPFVRGLFMQGKAIPITSAKQDPETLAKAMEAIARELEAGELVFVFPEGALTRDGQMARFRPGVEKVLARNPVPVVPMALNGLWGSFFSRKDGLALRKPFRRVWSKVALTIGEPIPPEQATAAHLEEVVRQMWEAGPGA